MRRRHKLNVVFMILCLAAGIAAGQVRSSTITGTVTDASGGVIPGAVVTVTNEETNVPQEARTNAVGEYTAP